VFAGFSSTEDDSFGYYAFGLNPYITDFVPIVYGRGNVYVDATEESLGYFIDPINTNQCGDFPCSGLWNVLFYNTDTVFRGNQPSYAQQKF